MTSLITVMTIGWMPWMTGVIAVITEVTTVRTPWITGTKTLTKVEIIGVSSGII